LHELLDKLLSLDLEAFFNFEGISIIELDMVGVAVFTEIEHVSNLEDCFQITGQLNHLYFLEVGVHDLNLLGLAPYNYQVILSSVHHKLTEHLVVNLARLGQSEELVVNRVRNNLLDCVLVILLVQPEQTLAVLLLQLVLKDSLDCGY
jgi:hypothetical protein